MVFIIPGCCSVRRISFKASSSYFLLLVPLLYLPIPSSVQSISHFSSSSFPSPLTYPHFILRLFLFLLYVFLLLFFILLCFLLFFLFLLLFLILWLILLI